jgi:ribonuclease H / adenosylcobalamin/alpha-ribazole phosphatase
LEEAAKLGATEVEVLMDSKLVVEQMSGRWKVKHPDLAVLHQQAMVLSTRFDRISYAWIPRLKNSHADRLANEAMDAAAEVEPPAETPVNAFTEPAKTANTPSSPAGWIGARGAPARFLLLRHGQTELSSQRRYSGRGNPALTDLGRRQADAAAQYLASKGGIAAVITSPLQRAYDTAVSAAKALGLDVTVDDDLIETDFGSWEGLTFGEATNRDPQLHRLWMRDTSITPPDGESFDRVADRVKRAQARIVAEHPGETVLVVSHVTPIKTLLQLALDAGPGILYRLHIDLASLSIAEFYPDGSAAVRLVNQTAYL